MAIHLAVEGQRRGLKTLLIDIDPQASAAKIMDRRGNEPPDVTTEAAARLERAIKAAESQEYELVIVDTAPQARLTFEQQVSKDITLTYITNLNYTAEQIVRFEWNLNRQWSAIAVRDSNGLFGIDIQYRKRFK